MQCFKFVIPLLTANNDLVLDEKLDDIFLPLRSRYPMLEDLLDCSHDLDFTIIRFFK
jgi:hypothetical protein